MKAKKLITKGVVFNLLDPDQSKLHKHATERSNFSAYIKRLIQRDLEGGLTYQITDYKQETQPQSDLDKNMASSVI